MKKFSAAILVEREKILLGKRNGRRDFFPGVWDFIGGHCRGNESFEAAMLRELFEEINIIPTNYEHFLTVDKSPDFIMHIYVVSEWSGEIRNSAAEENETLSWFTIEEARSLEFPDAEYLQILGSVEKFLAKAV